MSQHWRGDPSDETPVGRFLRNRWEPGSIYVLDIDHLICSPDGSKGVLIEEKHLDAKEKSARITQSIAQRIGWWAARFVYHDDECLRIDATFWEPDGTEHVVDRLSYASFDQWVCDTFGAKRRHVA